MILKFLSEMLLFLMKALKTSSTTEGRRRDDEGSEVESELILDAEVRSVQQQRLDEGLLQATRRSATPGVRGIRVCCGRLPSRRVHEGPLLQQRLGALVVVDLRAALVVGASHDLMQRCLAQPIDDPQSVVIQHLPVHGQDELV